jgi:hypothetical protein
MDLQNARPWFLYQHVTLRKRLKKLFSHLVSTSALKLMFALEDIVPIQSSGFCQVEFRSSLAPLVVFLMCCKGEHYVQTTLQCLFWMKQMNYSQDVPRDRSIFLPAYLLIVVIIVNDYIVIEVENDPRSIDSVHITHTRTHTHTHTHTHIYIYIAEIHIRHKAND